MIADGGPLEARAYAKINLGLEILGKRPDGYHEIRTVLQTVDFHDRLRFERSPGRDITLVSDLDGVEDDDNLVVRAARALARRAGIPVPGTTIRLEKVIPPGMGLGGGSADAAVTLMALDRLWNLGLKPPELHSIASDLGMDVPFFLYGGSALAVGAGAEVYPIELGEPWPVVLILPEFSIATAEAYSRLRLTKSEMALTLQHFAWSSPSRRDRQLDLVNHLEGATGEHASTIEAHKRSLIDLGALIAMMSGSGASIFGLFPTDSSASEAAATLARRGVTSVATRTLRAHEYRASWLSIGA